MNKLDVVARDGKLHESTPHDSAIKQVAGRAEYVDDLTEPAGTLHAYLGLSTRAHALIMRLDLDAVRKAPGVVGVLVASDIPGENDISSVHKHDEPALADKRVNYWGQPLFAVIGETREAARRATRLAVIEYADLPHVTDIAGAKAGGGGSASPVAGPSEAAAKPTASKAAGSKGTVVTAPKDSPGGATSSSSKTGSAGKAADELARHFKCGKDEVKIVGNSGRAVELASR